MTRDNRTARGTEGPEPTGQRWATPPESQRIRLWVDGHSVVAYEGETVAAALMAASVADDGFKATRITSRRKEPRFVYCGIGVCFDCVCTIDGQPNVRSCQTPVRDGMQVSVQHGEGEPRR